MNLNAIRVCFALCFLLLPAAEARRLSFSEALADLGRPDAEIASGSPLLEINFLFDERNYLKTSFKDMKNDYALWGSRSDKTFLEFAIWRTVNQRAIIGLNFVSVRPQPGCGDGPCGPTTRFVGFNGQRYVDLGRDTELMENVCRYGFVDFEGSPYLGAALLKTVKQRLSSFRGKLKNSGLALPMCLFPRNGTTITVAVASEELAFAFRGEILPLMYFKFDKVKGTFTASVNP